MKKPMNDKKRATLGRVLSYIGKYKYIIPVSILFAIFSTVLTLYVPVLIGDAIDLAVAKGDVDVEGIISKLTLGAVLIGVSALLQWMMSTLGNRLAFYVSRDIRNEAFAKVTRLPLSYIDGNAHGDTVNRIINDTERFSEGLLLGFTQVFTGALTIVGTFGFMLVLCWQIALVVLFITPLSIFIAKFIGGRTYRMFKARSEDEAAVASVIGEMVGNLKVVRAFGQEERAKEKFDSASDRLQRSSLDAIFFSSLTNPTTRFVNSLVYAAVALVGALIVIGSGNGVAAFTIGQFSVLLSYTNQYTKPFNEISGIFAEFQNALASAARVFDLIEEKSEPSDAPDAKALGEVRGEVELKSVSFSYTPKRPLIEDLDLSVKPGQRIAIVGPTGCGKTTLINLLMRFYDVCGGSISVDGNEIRDIKRAELRANYGMVLQDTWLSSTTVRNNIAYSRPNATDEEIEAAARAAHAHSFIKRLPQGYDTVISESGEGLSQGQRQLICIARVMLSLPPMLILDEATSSIDTRTEMKIQKAFLEMMEGRTSFIVAHRLSTIREADMILVMKDGHIIETGTHDELIARGGFYHNLYYSQFTK